MSCGIAIRCDICGHTEGCELRLGLRHHEAEAQAQQRGWKIIRPRGSYDLVSVTLDHVGDRVLDRGWSDGIHHCPKCAGAPIPSPSDIEAGRSHRGGWTRKTLEGWGVPWPAPKGWKKDLERRWDALNPATPAPPASRRTETASPPAGALSAPAGWPHIPPATGSHGDGAPAPQRRP